MAITLLSVFAVVVLELSVSQSLGVARRAQAVQLDTMNDSAIRVFIARLQSQALLSSEPIPERVELPMGIATVTFERESGRIDVNLASEGLLMALLSASGIPEEQAVQQARRLVDWRDQDDESLLWGAEVQEYRALGLADTPRNAPFESVEEVRRVMGFGAISPTILGALTVYSHLAEPKCGSCSELVARALRLADAREIDGRKWPTTPNPPPDAYDLIGDILRVKSCSELQGHRRCRSAVVRTTGLVGGQPQVFEWRSEYSGDN